MADKYLVQVNGVFGEAIANTTSAGAADAGKIVGLDPTGKLDLSLMPVGVGSETDIIVASESLLAGDFVNVWNSSGIKVRKADASVAGKSADGFVLAAVAGAGNATVYRLSQCNTQLVGMAVGAKQFLSASTPGGRTETAPSGSGNVIQILGIAKSATELVFSPQPPITLA